jgi:CubicO group peptidase (beta-lactamase class C family)
MTEAGDVLAEHRRRGAIPGGVVLVAHGDRIEVEAVGRLGLRPDDPPMEPDTLFRIASITKPITSAAALSLADDGRIGLDDPIAEWLPELAQPMVLRTPTGPLDDVVPADRPITLRHLLTSRLGWGFCSDFSLPAMQALFPVQPDGRMPYSYPPPEEWLNSLAEVPMFAQPGEAWLYDTSFYVLAILVARVAGQSAQDVFTERIFEPLGMTETGFTVPKQKVHRLARYYRTDGQGGLDEVDDRDSWTEPPRLESGSGGLVGTVGDWLRFARMLVSGGEVNGRRVLSEASARAMVTNQVSADQTRHAQLFLEGQGWGYGGAVDIQVSKPWEVPGRYGWVGGTGTAAYLLPSTGVVAIMCTQVGVDAPGTGDLLADFWTAAPLG